MFTVTIQNHQYQTPTILFASNVVNSVHENSGLGVRDLGCEFPVKDGNGETVAIVSYNGRIWTTEADWRQRSEISA